MDEKTARILIEAVATADAVLEPDFRALHFRKNGRGDLQHGQARFEAMQEYRANGATFLARDRTPAGRQETARQLSDLAKQGLLEVGFCAGRAAKVKLTPAGDDVARRLATQPTHRASLGILHKLVKLLQRRKFVRTWPPGKPKRKNAIWFRRDCVLLHAFAGRRGCTNLNRQGVLGEALPYLSPLLARDHVEWFTSTVGHCFLRPTDAGQELYASTDWSAVETDWKTAHDEEDRATWNEVDDDDRMVRNVEHYGAVFRRERQGLIEAKPKQTSELGWIPWPAVDADLQFVGE